MPGISSILCDSPPGRPRSSKWQQHCRSWRPEGDGDEEEDEEKAWQARPCQWMPPPLLPYATR